MALNVTKLEEDIKEAFKKQALKTGKDNETDPIPELANKIASAIHSYIGTGTVSTTVTGTCATPAGAGTITGSGSGSIS